MNTNNTLTTPTKRTSSPIPGKKSHKKAKKTVAIVKMENSAQAKRSKIDNIPIEVTPNNKDSLSKCNNNKTSSSVTKDSITAFDLSQPVQLTHELVAEVETSQSNNTNSINEIEINNTNSSLPTKERNDSVFVNDDIVGTNYHNNSYLNIIKKPPKFCNIGSDSILYSIRKYGPNLSHSIPTLSKMFFNNFNVVYSSKIKKRSLTPTMELRSSTSEPTAYSSTQFTNNNVYQFDSHRYRCCLLEDYMLITKNELVKVLVPTDNAEIDISNWLFLIDHNATAYLGTIQFQKNLYYVFEGIILTSSESSMVKAGFIPDTNLKWMFGVGNSGSLISFEVNNKISDKSILVTWTHVLTGRKDGIQVWSQRDNIRNLSENFRNLRRKDNNASKSEEYMLSFLNNVYPELYGDVTQLRALLSTYYKSLSSIKSNNTVPDTIIDLAEVDMNRPDVQQFLRDIDNSFKAAIDCCFTNFTPIGKPLLDINEMDLFIDRYKRLFPQHYNIMKRLLGIERKKKEGRNIHLDQYYDRNCFYQFLSQSRICSNHVLFTLGTSLCSCWIFSWIRRF